jgi:hypothetical protein
VSTRRTSKRITPSSIPGHPAAGGFTRRSLLKALGLGALTYALPLGRSTSAHAGPTTIPKRIIFFYGGGTMYDRWRPVGAGGAMEPTETSFDLGELHKPLEPHKADLLYMDGIGMVSEEIDPNVKGNAHQQGAKHAMAPYDSAGADLPGGISIDQYIAQALNTPSPVTAFPSLELVIAAWANELEEYSGAVASGAGQPLPGVWDPRKNYNRVFGNFTGGEDPALLEALKQRRASVFKLAKGEFPGLVQRVGGEDRTRLEAHLDLLADLEARLELGGVTCVKPVEADLIGGVTGCDFQCYDPTQGDQWSRNYALSADINTRIAVASLACDLTRVVFLDVRHACENDFGYTAGMLGTTDSHDLVHKVNNPAEPLSSDPTAISIISAQCLIEAQKLANLLEMLKSIPEGDGTLFDNTVVLWCGQIGYGSHDLANLPWVICGSGGGYFKTGRYIKYPKNASSGRGLPHNNLFVSLANSMGIVTNTFGNPSCCTGPLDKLTA